MTRTWQREERLLYYIPSDPSSVIAAGGWPHFLQMESGGCGHLIPKPCSIVVVHQIPLFSWRLRKSPHLYPRYILRISYITITTTTSAKFSRWDNNPEPIGSWNFKFKSGFKGRTDPDNDDEEDDDYEGRRGGGARKKRRKRRWWSDGPLGMDEEKPDIWEEFIDSIWIIKVFQSYGWASPAIILSGLLATGPKAFLFALALPLGQSILTFAFKKLWESTQGKGKTKRKRRRKGRQQPFARAAGAGNLDDDDEQEERQESVKRRMGYKSWVGNDNGPVDEGSGNATHFGGWDELDDGMGSTMGRTQRSSKKAGRSRRRPSVAHGRFSKGGRESEMPLLLRLLIAVFPFLGSWTRML